MSPLAVDVPLIVVGAVVYFFLVGGYSKPATVYLVIVTSVCLRLQRTRIIISSCIFVLFAIAMIQAPFPYHHRSLFVLFNPSMKIIHANRKKKQQS